MNITRKNYKLELDFAFKLYNQYLNDEIYSQKALRESVSLCYYALFHALSHEGVKIIYKIKDDDPRQFTLARLFEHGNMRKACEAIINMIQEERKNSKLGFSTRKEKVSVFFKQFEKSDFLFELCTYFVEFQASRHEADYDLRREFSNDEVRLMLMKCSRILAEWERNIEDSSNMDKETREERYTPVEVYQLDAFILALLHYSRSGRQ
jgi:uncharacterized protein (UPF0332 family)